MSTADVEPQATQDLVDRLFGATIGALEVASVHVGGRLGLYRSLAEDGVATPKQLAARTGTSARYVREWLEQQAVAGFLTVDDVDVSPDERRYRLPEAHRPVLVDEVSLDHLTPVATLAVAAMRPLDDVIAAYRSGAGVPYEAYGADARDGIAGMNRPQFEHQLGQWLAAMPDVDARLREPGARVADVACGLGWSSIAIARAYPTVTVDALDVDEASIADAHHHVVEVGLVDRVHPAVHDASSPTLPGRYDLVTVFEALHDMNHPVEALRTIRASLTDGGTVLIADERVAERFTAPGDDIERFNYGWSVLHCLPVGMLEPDSAGTGTVIRPDTVRAYAAEAGFRTTEVLPIEHDFWRFYRLDP